MDATGKTTTVYDDLLKRIRRSIGTGELKPGVLIGSEHELVRESGISRVSVRRAVDQLVKEGLVERRAGKGLYVRPANRSMRVVQVVVPNIAFDQCVQITRGAQTLGVERGVQVQVYDAHSRLDWDLEMLRSLPETEMAGAIIVSWHHERFAEAVYELKRREYPFVLVDERLQQIDVSSVIADNYGGGYAMGKALLAQGHRRIAFVGSLAADTVQARLNGLRDAVNDAGVAFDRTLAVDLATPLEGDWEAAISGATRRVLDRANPATAVFCADDQTAAHAYGAIRAMGRRIPDDVSVAGFDDNPLCQFMEPGLTTVRQPSAEMGRLAMEMLLDRITDPRRHAEHRVVPVELVVRGSIAAAADAAEPSERADGAKRRHTTGRRSPA